MKKNHYLQLKDEELIARILGDNQTDMFEVLYNRYYRKVLDKCNSMLKNQNLAIEFTEDIFSKVFEKLASYKKKSSFSSWLYAVTYNHCIDYLREKKNLHYPEWNRNHEIPEIVDDPEGSMPEITLENLQVVLEMIHPEEKALLIMKYHDNIPMKEIGKSLKISEDAAKMRIKRARTRVLFLYQEKFLKKNRN